MTLTGATGFLGAFLLRELLARTDAQIVCLVRAPEDALVADPIASVRAVYAAQGRELSVEAEVRMRRWLAEHPANRHGAHRYGLDKFGLEAGEVKERFAAYEDRYRGLL